MTRQVQPSRRRIIQFGILTSQGLQSAQMRRCKDLETPKKHYLSRSRRADFGRRWKTRTCPGRKYWRMIHHSKDIFRCECCFLNTSETISLSGDSSPSPREFCSVQYWPVDGAKDWSGEELVFNSPNSQYQKEKQLVSNHKLSEMENLDQLLSWLHFISFLVLKIWKNS